MPFATGTAANMNALHVAINNFASSNGFTVTGDVIHSGNSFTKLTETTGEILTLSGAGSVDMLTDPAPATTSMRILAGKFPVTYELFIHGVSGNNANPLHLIAIVKYDSGTHTWLSFGEFSKFKSDMVGGSYFASIYREGALANGSQPTSEVDKVQMTAIQGGHSTFNAEAHSGGFFWANESISPTNSRLNSFVRCTFDTVKWPYSKTNLILRPLLERQPNTWNGQTVFFPCVITTKATDNMEVPLGIIPNIRFVRVDNYNSGDIITYGVDRWKIYPFWKKDTLNRNGVLQFDGNGSCGTFGWAIKYDGA